MSILWVLGLGISLTSSLLLLFFYLKRKNASGLNLSGNMLEDYVRGNQDCVTEEGILCRHCKENTVITRNIGWYRENLIREHVCDRCKCRLYFSLQGKRELHDLGE